MSGRETLQPEVKFVAFVGMAVEIYPSKSLGLSNYKAITLMIEAFQKRPSEGLPNRLILQHRNLQVLRFPKPLETVEKYGAGAQVEIAVWVSHSLNHRAEVNVPTALGSGGTALFAKGSLEFRFDLLVTFSDLSGDVWRLHDLIELLFGDSLKCGLQCPVLLHRRESNEPLDLARVFGEVRQSDYSFVKASQDLRCRATVTIHSQEE